MRAITLRSLTLLTCETLLILAAIGAAAYIRLGDWAWEILGNEQGVWKMILMAAVTQGCLYYGELYNVRLMADRRELFTRCIQALAAAAFILAVVYFWFPNLIVGRGVFLIAATFIAGVVMGWRMIFAWVSQRVRPRERLLLVGTGTAAVDLARELFERRFELGVEIVGFVDPDPARVGMPVINPGIIGVIEDIPDIVRARSVDRVVVSLSDARGKLPMDRLLDMRLDGVTFDHLASLYEEYTGKIALENLRPSWLIFSEGFRKSRLLTLSKRAVDIVAGVTGLVAGAPLMGLVALALKLPSPGPVL